MSMALASSAEAMCARLRAVSGRRVLVVDDDPDIRELLVSVLL
jgi:hypothetical protein